MGGLADDGAPCRLEFLAQALTLPAEPLESALERLALSFGAFRALAQDLDLAARRRIGAMDPARPGYARSLKNSTSTKFWVARLLRAAGMAGTR